MKTYFNSIICFFLVNLSFFIEISVMNLEWMNTDILITFVLKSSFLFADVCDSQGFPCFFLSKMIRNFLQKNASWIYNQYVIVVLQENEGL